MKVWLAFRVDSTPRDMGTNCCKEGPQLDCTVVKRTRDQ